MIRLRLDALLSERGCTRYRLSKETGIKYQTLDKYFKNQVVRYDSFILDKICHVLRCTPGDLFSYSDTE